MKTNDKSDTLPAISQTDLKDLSFAELQDRLDAYSARGDTSSQQQRVTELLHELQVHQIELEMQNRDLQESQQQLEEARDRYADLYDFAPVCYITFDAVGCIREINLTGTAMLGQERTRLLGKPFSLWLTREARLAFFRHLREAQQGNQVVTRELQLRFAKGQCLDVRLETVRASEAIDNKPAYRSVIIDITARKQAEREIQHQAQQLRLITDAIPILIAYVDSQERHQFANKAYAGWFQRSCEGIVGRTVRDVVGEQVYPKIADSIRIALAGTPVNFELSMRNQDGVDRDISASYLPDFAGDGTVLGYFALIQDVTDVRKHELLDKMHLLETAHVARINTMGEMVAEIAHELNQPLSAITIYSDAVSRMLQKDNANPGEMLNALNEIRLQAGRASEVISRLREFVTKRELQAEQTQINTLVEEVMNLISVEARWYGAEVKLELGQAIPPVTVDRILIEQVILNLTRNAIEAMEAIEPAKRQLLIKTDLGNHNAIELAVEDCGPGMTIAEIEKIFEPFYTSKPHGMGLGLSISRSIIKAHHGRLWAIPNECGGTTFTFTLPYSQRITEDE
jgi:two-component system sensor kinase FixL